MKLHYGWVGKILRVDLTTGQVTEERTDKYAPKFIGGRAMAARVYWEEVGSEVGAYDPGNKIIIMTGPTTGTLEISTRRPFYSLHKGNPIVGSPENLFQLLQ